MLESFCWGFKPATLLKKETTTQVYSYKFCKIFKNFFLTFFMDHLQWLLVTYRIFTARKVAFPFKYFPTSLLVYISLDRYLDSSPLDNCPRKIVPYEIPLRTITFRTFAPVGQLSLTNSPLDNCPLGNCPPWNSLQDNYPRAFTTQTITPK